MATVCVTGASGYVGSHVVRELLARGHRVRATVRDAQNPVKTSHLKALVEAPEHPLELFSADLFEEGSFDAAIDGCDAVCHVAAVARLAAKDPQREIVDPSVRGTANVLASIAKAGTVKVLVQTSSVAAVGRGDTTGEQVFTEADWNETATLKTDPYGLAKTVAERAVWDFCAERDLRLVVINPGLVLGPLYTKAHTKASPTIVRDLLVRSFPACPQIHFSVVDVREVAYAQAEAVERESAEGRHLLVHDGLWMADMARLIKADFPDIKVPTGKLPNIFMYGAALFDKRLSWTLLRRLLSRRSTFANEKSREALGVVYRPLEETIRDTVQSMLDQRLVTPKR